MTIRVTLFTATLVQDSALSVSGVDRESTADQPFSLVDGVPIMAGRGIKGALTALARRFFDPLPRSVSEDPFRRSAFRRSAWEIANARPVKKGVTPGLRAGVGIRQKTGARAQGVLYDLETIPAGTRWALEFRTDWSIAGNDAVEAEGILGYVLSRHWAAGRCWLGGGISRGLGWCHIENLRAYRLDTETYERWIESDRQQLPDPLREVPIVKPTRSWCFRTLDVEINIGEYRPDPDGPSWGLDMLAIGPHDDNRGSQPTGDGTWARPSWSSPEEDPPEVIDTDRAITMAGDRPLLPGSSMRGPLRHALSRIRNAEGSTVQDPHLVQGKVDMDDEAGRVFGTVDHSSRVLVRDAVAEGAWFAAKLHMHAEDEFSAGSYGSAKRDAVRLLRGDFPLRIVVEGPDEATVGPLTEEIDRTVALGTLGHLPIGGHKTRGAGWCRWKVGEWVVDDVIGQRTWAPPQEPDRPKTAGQIRGCADESDGGAGLRHQRIDVFVHVSTGALQDSKPLLGDLAETALEVFGEHRPLVAWWCEPAIDLDLRSPPPTFGRKWPRDETANSLKVEEVAFFSSGAAWRAARTARGWRWVFIEETEEDHPMSRTVQAVVYPARLHASRRFTAADTGGGHVLLREWYAGDEVLGFTLEKGDA